MSTKASAATPTVRGADKVVEDIDMKPPPKMKKQLSITTPTWDARADAEINEKDERRRQSEVFKKEIERQASLLGADLGTMSAMAMVEGDDDDDDDEIPMSTDQPKAVLEDKPEKGKADSSNQKASSSSNAATMPSEEDQKEESRPPDPLNGCYEPVSQRTLGSGAYGVVSKVKCLKVAGNSRAKVGEIYALKKIRNVFRNRTDAKRILRELRILRAMRHHDCIVRVIDILIPTDLARFKDLYVVFELIDTDMSRVFNSDQNFKLLHVKYFLYQILRALKYMHSANLVHRDLKPANVLVNEDCSLRVADFGLSRCISEIPESLRGIFHSGKKMRKQLTEHMQTRWYRAPEVCLLEQRRDTQFAMDVWGAGCILGELLQMVVENQSDYTKRKPLFRGTWSYKHSPRHGKMDVESSQIARIIEVLGTPDAEDDLWFCSEKAKGLIAEIPHAKPQPMKNKFPGTPEEGIHLLKSMLHFDPRKRLDVDGCLQHPFLAEVRQPCDELKHQKVTFEFEDVDLQSSLIRELIIEEIAFYHPDFPRIT